MTLVWRKGFWNLAEAIENIFSENQSLYLSKAKIAHTKESLTCNLIITKKLAKCP